MSAVGFKQVKDAEAGEKLSFIGTVIKQDDLKSGTKNGQDYTYKKFTIQDVTGDIELVAWNDDVKQFKIGNKYEFIDTWCKDYQGKLSLGITYAKVKLIGTSTTQATMPESTTTTPEPTPEDAKPSKEEINGNKLPASIEAFNEFVEIETVMLLQIEKTVTSTMKHYLPKLTDVNGQKVGMFVKEIYRLAKQTNFKKASEV